jgi:hypothetical protein
MLGVDSRRLDDFNRSVHFGVNRKEEDARGWTIQKTTPQSKKVYHGIEVWTKLSWSSNKSGSPGLASSSRSPNQFGIDKANEACYAVQLLLSRINHPAGYVVELSDGAYQIDRRAFTLTVHHTPGRATHSVRIRPAA